MHIIVVFIQKRLISLKSCSTISCIGEPSDIVVSDEAAPLENQPNEQEDETLVHVARGFLDGMKSKANELGNKAEGYLNKAQGKLFTRLTHGTTEGKEANFLNMIILANTGRITAGGGNCAVLRYMTFYSF